MQVWKKPDFLSSKKQMNTERKWHDVKGFENTYEILDDFPYIIRKKANGKILKETLNAETGYYMVSLNGVLFYKHRIIAIQFIPNPYNLPCVDHKNNKRHDNHISNLRWLSYEDNARNKLSSKGVIYEFCQYGEEPEDLIEVTDYGNHKFKKYYYSPSEDIFYYDNKAKFRQLYYNKKSDDCYYVIAKDTDGNRVNIYYNTFMKLYGLV